MTGNLFSSLFSYRPRENLLPKENFLTEAFAWVLRDNPALASQLISLILHESGDENVSFTKFKIETQESYPTKRIPNAPDVNIQLVRPDMEICFRDTNNNPHWILFEHKWERSADDKQLLQYRKLLDSATERGHLVFIGRDVAPRDFAIHAELDLILTWTEIYRLITTIKNKTFLAEHFLLFLEDHNMAPLKPFESDELIGYVKGMNVEDKCVKLIRRLLDSKVSWHFLPHPFRDVSVTAPSNSFGRIGIQFVPEWRPGLFAGFYLNPYDLKLPLVNEEKSIDLALFLDADPGDRPKREELESALSRIDGIVQDHAKTNNRKIKVTVTGFKNRWRILAIQESLQDVIDMNPVNDEQQLAAIYEWIKEWSELIFKDGRLTDAFHKTWNLPE